MKKPHPAQASLMPDLKHDSMEYAASSEEPIELTTMDDRFEDEAITAEELDRLEEDDIDTEAMAFVSAQNDSLSDEDNFLNSPDEDTEEEDDDTSDDDSRSRK